MPDTISAPRHSGHRRSVRLAVLALLILGSVLVGAAASLPSDAAGVPPGKTWLISKTQAAVLGVVEGVTEYLPVSSTGHLLLTQHLLGIAGQDASQQRSLNAYLIIIQFGAILAVLLLYFGRVRQVFAGFLGRNPDGLRLAGNLVMGLLPAAVVGVLLEKRIDALFDHYAVQATAFALFAGGIVILWVARRRRSADPLAGLTVDQLTLVQALVIGGMQCLAMWPGVSRSLATILGGLLVGMSMGAAVEFSFLLGLITLTAATVVKMRHVQGIVDDLGITAPLIGIAFAGLAAFVAVKWMVGYLNRHGLELFGYYRLALAAIVLGLMFLGFLS